MRKRLTLTTLILAISLLISACAKSAAPEESNVTIYVAVLGQENGTICVTPVQNDVVTEELIMLPWEDGKYIRRGTILCVEYDGMLEETFPVRIGNPISITEYEEKDIQIDGEKYMAAYDSYIHFLMKPDYPCGPDALNRFVRNIADGNPSKYAYYFLGDEGDPVILYYEYVVNDVIGNYILEGYDTTYDKWSAQPGISYYKYPYIYKNEFGGINVGECVNLAAYDSVINFSSGIGSYVYCNLLGEGTLNDNFTYGDVIPVLRINSAATATLGIDPIANPNVITVNDNGTMTEITLEDMGDYLARGVYFRSDDSFAIVCENMAETAEYLIRDYIIQNGAVSEEGIYYAEELPFE